MLNELELIELANRAIGSKSSFPRVIPHIPPGLLRSGLRLTSLPPNGAIEINASLGGLGFFPSQKRKAQTKAKRLLVTSHSVQNCRF
jgi:hypothetical protein